MYDNLDIDPFYFHMKVNVHVIQLMMKKVLDRMNIQMIDFYNHFAIEKKTEKKS